MKGAQQHRDRLAKLAGAGMRKAVRRVLHTGADLVRSEAFRSISAGSIEGAGHVVSKPGEAPNREFGDLQSGLEIAMVSDIVSQVSSNAPHAAPLEFSTSNMAARPYMRPARDKMKPQIEKLFAEEMSKLVRSSG